MSGLLVLQEPRCNDGSCGGEFFQVMDIMKECVRAPRSEAGCV